MGPRTRRNSTRAGKARSVNSRPKPRKPTTPKRSKVHAASETLRDLRERQVDATLKFARTAEPARTAADTLRREQDLLRPAASALRQIREKLELVCSCAIVVEHALMEQNCELDDDAALVLKRHVGDELDRQIERIDLLLGAPPRDGLNKEADDE